ncbi:response regulator transcription factor [Gracilibacillus alcaliphilus]|uniref:response regulator transcription factor n=1 Tax=Gracilibacillus alcaliphilus TaxID=1401441 RepID=UPI0019561F96|nr:response regulator transcription factor [Gracilibacillus alcaliphilus]MBM7679056.1 two-component system response regulator YesN [Gracilibacillus alcaliphilus]
MKSFYKVLVVDDELLIRRGIINYLDWEQEGFQIVGEASNGKEAIKLITERQPHIVISDIVMPELNGVELVKYLKEHHPQIEIIVLSSFEDFEYVKQAFQYGVADYILKPKLQSDDLLHTLQGITKKLAHIDNEQPAVSIQEILRKIIDGYQTIREMETVKKHFSFDHFVLIKIFWKKGVTHHISYHPFEQILTTSFSACEIIDLSNDHDHCLALINFTKEQWPAMQQALLQTIDYFDTNHNQQKWMISTPFTSLDQLAGICQEQFAEMEKDHFYLPDQKWLQYGQLPAKEAVQEDFDLNHFIDLFKQKQFEKAIHYLRKHIQLLQQQREMEIFAFKSWLENIIFNIVVLLSNMALTAKGFEEQKYQYLTRITDAFHIQEVMDILEEFISEVEQQLPDEEEHAASHFQLILDYIETYYHQRLTLQTLADQFHFNPSYLSSYFTRHHQEGFSEYLNKVRIKYAKERLRTTNESITAISEAVGFSDPSYFTKVFKKMEQQSPRSYRKAMKQAE